MARSQARFHRHDGTGTGTIVWHDGTGAVAQSQGGVGSLPIDISEKMMPMLSLQLYAATPQCGRLHADRNADFVVYSTRG